MGWIGVDFDGTLAHYEGYKGPGVLGAPVPKMVDKVRRWLDAGKQVKIFTARAHAKSDDPVDHDEAFENITAIKAWCKEHLGQVLEITCVKDHKMITLYDDRCRQVVTNTGVIVYRENT